MQRVYRYLLTGTAVFVLAACNGQRADPAPDNEVPPENGNITINPQDPNNPDPNNPDPNDPNNPINNPPPPVDCNALPVNGQTLNCGTLLSTPEAFCANVYGNPAAPNFTLVSSCGSCNAQYFTPPAGAAEQCLNDVGGGVVVPPPVDNLALTSCKTCHAPNGYDGVQSIEDPHPWSSVDCATCHGGDPTATNPVFAHVCAPPAIGNRQQQVLDTRAFFLSWTTAGVQFLPDYTCAQQGGGTKVKSDRVAELQKPR
jgi:hypothetical protein